MKKFVVFIFFIFFSENILSQVNKIDSLKKVLAMHPKPDLVRMGILNSLSKSYADSRPDSAIILGQLGLKIAIKYTAKEEQTILLKRIAGAYSDLGDYAQSFKIYFKLRDAFQQKNDLLGVADMDNAISYTFDYKGEYDRALSYSKSGLKVLKDYETVHFLKSKQEQKSKCYLYLNSGSQFMDLNKLDSAEHYLNLSYSVINQYHIKVDIIGVILYDLAEIEKRKGSKELALKKYRQSIPFSKEDLDIDNLCQTYLGMADLYHKYKQRDSAKYYANKALEIAYERKFLQDEFKAAQALNRYFEEDKNIIEAYHYLQLTGVIKDSLFSQDKIRQLLALDFDEKQRERDIEDAKEKEQARVRLYMLVSGIVILILLAFIFWRESRQRAKANKLLQKQQADLDLINQNLESMIAERTHDLVDKNKKLFEYSYYLSHQIRGPVSTIKGLVNIEKEGLIEQHDFVKMVGTCVADIDNKIREINDILHEPIEPLQ